LARRERRRARERAIIATTRALFDERGLRDAPIDEIASAAGINKALIYRAFDSKEEIFVLTVTDYLAELEARGREDRELEDPVAALRQAFERYVGFCLEYPAFLDCALSLMQQPASELRERVSGEVWFRLGRAMAGPLGHLERILTDGAERGVFAIEDPDFTANRMYAQVLGSMHLARAGVGVREAAPGVAAAFSLDPEAVREACIEDALAVARISHTGQIGSA
jgi:AcrR family transcriptional regulator